MQCGLLLVAKCNGDACNNNEHHHASRNLCCRESILQRIVQILKRHRDIMFNGDEDKPISIIITTLASRAYRGETNLSKV